MAIDDTVCGIKDGKPQGALEINKKYECVWRVVGRVPHYECKYFKENNGNNLRMGRCLYEGTTKDSSRPGR